MSGCLDRVDCSCECVEPAREWLKPKRNMFASIVSGTLVSVIEFTNEALLIFTLHRYVLMIPSVSHHFKYESILNDMPLAMPSCGKH